MVRARGLVVLGIAFGAHAGVLLAVSSIRAPSLRVDAASPPIIEIALEATEPQETPSPAASLPGSAVDALPLAEKLQGRTPWAARAEGPPTASREVPPPGGETPPPETGASEWSFAPGPVRIDLAAAVTPDLVAPPRERPADPEPTPRPASTTGGLAEGLAAHDVEVGAGRGGAVLTAAEAAARDGDAPTEGGATFQVRIGANGAVDARILSADPDPSLWARVAESLVRSVDPRRVRIPPGARGWQVVVRVDARMRLADGREVRSLRGLHGSIQPSVLEEAIAGKADAGAASRASGGPDLRDEESHTDTPLVGGKLGRRGTSNAGAAAAQGLAQRLLPTPKLGLDGKIWSPSLEATPAGVTLGGPLTPENLGQGPQRIVSGRILSEGSI